MEEQETLNAEVPQMEDSALKKQFNTVTPFSKLLSLVLFIALPLLGFVVGYELGSESTTVDLAATHSVPAEEVVEQESVSDDEMIEEREPVNIGEYISPDEPVPQPEFVDVVADGETFYFRYYGAVPGESCTAEKRYLDCINSTGLISGYKLPSEFDTTLEDSLYIDFCNFGFRVNEKVDNIYCVGEYQEVLVPKQVSELGNVEAQTERNKYECTFELQSLAIDRRAPKYVVLSGQVLNPECKI